MLDSVRAPGIVSPEAAARRVCIRRQERTRAWLSQFRAHQDIIWRMCVIASLDLRLEAVPYSSVYLQKRFSHSSIMFTHTTRTHARADLESHSVEAVSLRPPTAVVRSPWLAHL